MNDRLLPYLALPPDVLDEPFLRPCTDETSFSHLARIASVFPEYSSVEIADLTFGFRPSAKKGVLHLGWGRYQEYFQRHGCHINVMEHSSPLPLFRPFVEAASYANAENTALFRRAGSCSPIQQKNTYSFRTNPAICPECVASDLNEVGFAWYRRTHQVLAVTCCPNHGTTLLDACPFCGEKISMHDLQTLTCGQCNSSLRFLDQGTPAELAAARVVQAIYEGRFPVAPSALRLATLRTRVAERVSSRSGIVGDNLARVVVQHFGRNLLNSLSWAPDMSPTFAWPILLIHGLHFMSHPTANILLISMLFDSVEDYATALKQQRIFGLAETIDGPRPLVGACNITPALLRASYRHTIEEAAVIAGGSDKRLCFWLSAYPGLRARRKAFFARQQPKRDRKILEAHVRHHPQATRTSLKQVCERQLWRIRTTDPAWLDRTIPRNTGGRPVTNHHKNSPPMRGDGYDLIKQGRVR
jgi:hypothetical protein